MQEDRPLASRFEGFEAAPSDALWGNIEAGLSEKRKRRAIFWWFWGSAAVLVLSFGIYKKAESSTNLETAQTTQLRGKSQVKNKQAVTKTNQETVRTTAINPSIVIPQTLQGVSRNASKNKSNSSETITTPEVSKNVSWPVKSSSFEVNSDQGDYATVELPNTMTEENDSLPTNSLPNIPETTIDDIEPTNTRKKVFEIGFALGTGQGRKIINTPPNPTPSPINAIVFEGLDFSENADPNIQYWVPVSPFSIQLTFGRDLGRKFRVSSGLGFAQYGDRARLKEPKSWVLDTKLNVFQMSFTLDYKLIAANKLEWSTGPGIVWGVNHIQNGSLKTNRYLSSVQWQTALRYNISENWSAYLQPHYRFQLSDSDSGKSAFYHNHFYGLNVGFVRRF